jgi:ATP-dependent helicase HrpA
VSLFAQELGTAEPVSAVKLDRALAALRAGGTTAAPAPVREPAPIVVAAVPEKKKGAPLKNLGALDALFRK